MEILVKRYEKVKLKSILIQFPIEDLDLDDVGENGRWSEEQAVVLNDLLFYKDQETFEIEINLDTGEILTNGFNNIEINLKDINVKDGGSYTIFDSENNNVFEILEDYVPRCVPNDYGDYIHLNIKDGFVLNWNKDLCQKDFDDFIGDSED